MRDSVLDTVSKTRFVLYKADFEIVFTMDGSQRAKEGAVEWVWSRELQRLSKAFGLGVSVRTSERRSRRSQATTTVFGRRFSATGRDESEAVRLLSKKVYGTVYLRILCRRIRRLAHPRPFWRVATPTRHGVEIRVFLGAEENQIAIGYGSTESAAVKEAMDSVASDSRFSSLKLY